MAAPKEKSSKLDIQAGTASDENNQRPSSAHNRHSLTKGKESSCGSNATNKEMDRARLVRERQNEERARKLEELRQQALAAQRFRDQRDEERRKRIEELRSRDNDRRCQVEERKRQICEADQERRDAIMRKNQEREARIEAKRKNERSHIVFAFGSSTPRMLEPADTGGAAASFWGTRRATSTSNVMMSSFNSTGSAGPQPLTRRSSERELDAGSKKRATSAGGLDRKPGEDMRMSSSMYEVFNWNDTPDPSLTPAKSKRDSLFFPQTTDIFYIDDMSMIDVARHPMTQRGASGDDDEPCFNAGGGGPTTPTSSSYGGMGFVTRHANRRRTDLMPTIPSPRDSSKEFPGTSSGRSSSAKSFTRSPGRTYSMSRLDQLAQPRRRPMAQQHPQSPQPQQQSLAALSMSRSMSHLVAVHGLRGVSGPLRRTDNSRSMSTLPGSGLELLVPAPRFTRAERLRRKAREHSQNHHQQSQQQQLNNSGVRSGEVTPSSPSRPHSSMSQQSGTSSIASVTSGVGSAVGVCLRPRPMGTPRRPRPASIAGTGVSSFTTTSSNSISGERNNVTGDPKAQKDAKPPLPRLHHVITSNSSCVLKKQPMSMMAQQISSAIKSATLDRKFSGAGSRSSRPSPRATPKPTPLQSPGIEQLPPLQLELSNTIATHKQQQSQQQQAIQHNKDATEDESKHKLLVSDDDKPQIVQESNEGSIVTNSSTRDTEPTENELKNPENLTRETSLALGPAFVTPALPPFHTTEELAKVIALTEQQATSPVEKVDKKDESEPAKLEADLEDQGDMTASMIQKIRITTEEEAKAALAERRRLAREQAEREAELERQRLEELALLEAERLRAEEEEQRRLEEETLRLAQEAREAEEQRLKQAIEEAKRREEEDRKRREEEARQKAEKEEAERKAKIEAEKQRLEMEQRLKKEEEERNARRKRVEAIMSRTRKSQANAQKGEGNDGEKSKEDSPSDESKPAPGDKSGAQDLMTTSLIFEATQQFISSEQRSHSNSTSPVNSEPNNGLLLHHNNGTGHSNGIAGIENSSNKSLLDNENNTAQQQELNGHHNSMSNDNGLDANKTIPLDHATVKQNNLTNDLLDLSDFDELSNINSSPILLMQQRPFEDSISLNTTAIPFTPSLDTADPVSANFFQDSFSSNKQQQDNQVTEPLM